MSFKVNSVWISGFILVGTYFFPISIKQVREDSKGGLEIVCRGGCEVAAISVY